MNCTKSIIQAGKQFITLKIITIEYALKLLDQSGIEHTKIPFNQEHVANNRSVIFGILCISISSWYFMATCQIIVDADFVNIMIIGIRKIKMVSNTIHYINTNIIKLLFSISFKYMVEQRNFY